MNTAWAWKNNLKKNLAGILALCMFMPMIPHSCSTTGAHQRHEEKAKDAGNKICPVSGKRIDAETKANYEYKGKIYNFCCSTCIEEFKNDPEKYIKNLERRDTKEGTMGVRLP